MATYKSKLLSAYGLCAVMIVDGAGLFASYSDARTNPRQSESTARWRPRTCGKRNGAFFRLMKSPISRPPCQAATGGTRQGKG